MLAIIMETKVVSIKVNAVRPLSPQVSLPLDDPAD